MDLIELIGQRYKIAQEMASGIRKGRRHQVFTDEYDRIRRSLPYPRQTAGSATANAEAVEFDGADDDFGNEAMEVSHESGGQPLEPGVIDQEGDQSGSALPARKRSRAGTSGQKARTRQHGGSSRRQSQRLADVVPFDRVNEDENEDDEEDKNEGAPEDQDELQPDPEPFRGVLSKAINAVLKRFSIIADSFAIVERMETYCLPPEDGIPLFHRSQHTIGELARDLTDFLDIHCRSKAAEEALLCYLLPKHFGEIVDLPLEITRRGTYKSVVRAFDVDNSRELWMDICVKECCVFVGGYKSRIRCPACKSRLHLYKRAASFRNRCKGEGDRG